MGLTIRHQLTMGGVAVFLVAVLTAWLGYRQASDVRDDVELISLVHAPLANAALEMELNLLGMGLAVMVNLEDGNSDHMRRSREEADDFSRYLGKYESLANTPELQELGSRANEGFERFREIGTWLVEAKREQTAKFLEYRQLAQAMKDVIKKELRPGVTADASQAADKRDAILKMEFLIDDIERIALLPSPTASDTHALLQDNAEQSTREFARYASTPLSTAEKALLERSERDFAAMRKDVEEWHALAAGIRQKVGEFTELIVVMDNLLDDEIQATVDNQVATKQTHVVKRLQTMTLFLTSLLLGGLIITTAVGATVYRGITGPISHLREATMALARGDQVVPEDLQSYSEFSELTLAFSEMVAARQRSDEEVQRLNEGLEARIEQRTLELDAMNRALERRNEEDTLITQMSNLLHVANAMPEAGTILSRTLRKLLEPHECGVYLHSPALDHLECLVQWGDCTTAAAFVPDDCWALRRGDVYAVDDPAHDVLCTHMQVDKAGKPSLCIPMMA